MSSAAPRSAAASPVRFLDLTGRAVRRLQASYRASEDARLPAFRLVLDDESVYDFGSGETAFTARVRDRAGRAALASLDETKVCEAYMAGSIDLDGDMLAVLRLRPLLSDRHPLRRIWNRVLHPIVFGQVASDKKWIAEHYDEDAEFYSLFLDPTCAYSQGVFESDDEPLATAIQRKLDFALSSTRAREGQRLLDIGAGWGAMTEHAGRRGIRTTSLTISKPSETHVNELIRERELPCEVLREHFLEYRTDEPFDAIVNLGVTEHLPDYKASLEQYERLLKPGGRVYLDASSAREKFSIGSFTNTYIFPGNSTFLCLHDYLAEVAQSPFEVVAVYNDRESYGLTCRHWAERLESARDEIVRRWDKGLFRRFQLYLWGSVDAFAQDLLTAYRVVLELGPRAVG